MSRVFLKIDSLSRKNNTAVKGEVLKKWITIQLNRNPNVFIDDFNETSKMDRYSSGKVEKELFPMLADVCAWSNANDNDKDGSNILIDLGYLSYKIKPDRFKQKIENLLKKLRAKKSLSKKIKKIKSKKVIEKIMKQKVESHNYSKSDHQDPTIDKPSQKCLPDEQLHLSAPLLDSIPSNLNSILSDISSLPSDISSLPSDINSMPFDINSMPFDINSMPFDISPIPFDISPIPSDISPMPSDISPMPSDISLLSYDISLLPYDISPMPLIRSGHISVTSDFNENNSGYSSQENYQDFISEDSTDFWQTNSDADVFMQSKFDIPLSEEITSLILPNNN